MKIKKILVLIFFSLTIMKNSFAKECFIASENNNIIYQEGDCDTRYTPASTFKIAISLMGFDTGILIDETHPTWDFKPDYVDWLDRWKQPHNPKLWLANSCVWFSQIVTKKLGANIFSEYVRKFNYGNNDVSGDITLANGLTDSWLSSSLAISPREQINFINQLNANQLDVSLEAHTKTKNIMYLERLPDGWELYGKTGNGSQLDANGKKIKDRQIGWFVGFVKKNNIVITFVQLIADESKQETYASLRAKEKLKNNLEKMIINHSP